MAGLFRDAVFTKLDREIAALWWIILGLEWNKIEIQSTVKEGRGGLYSLV